MKTQKQSVFIYVCFISIIVVWWFLWYQYSYDSKQANSAADTTVSNLSKAFEENILGTMRHLDEFLLTLRRDYRKRPDRIPELIVSYNQHSEKELIIQLSIIDSKGIMVYSTLGMPSKPLDLSDREHFSVQLNSNEDKLFISKPVKGRASNKWSIQLTRKIINDDGTFAGVAVLSVDPDYFTGFYRNIDVGKKGVITLVGTDGVIRARSSAATRGVDHIGALVSSTNMMLDHAKPPVGIYHGPSPVDGVSRITSYRRLKSYPLEVMVALSENEAFRVLRWHRTIMILQGILASAGILLIFWMNHRHDTRQLQITKELHHSRQQLAEINAELEHRVANEVLKNREKDGILIQQDKMASIGQLAAGVAHEINNPIGFINSNLGSLEKYLSRLIEFIGLQTEKLTELASPELFGEVEAKRKSLKLDYIINDAGKLVRESLDGSDRVRKIVQDLKTFSRLGEADYKNSDINECLESTINIVWSEIKYKATLKKELGIIQRIRCNPQQLSQVFMNLLVNASHAIENQGEIVLRTWCEGENAFVTVSDTGTGIPPEIINRVFEPFFTTKDVGKGTGLGLSISYDIVKKHNGDIKVESTPGMGTTFTVRLPMNLQGFESESNRNFLLMPVGIGAATP